MKYIYFLLIFLVFSCIEDNTVPRLPESHEALHRNFDKWKKIDLQHYSFSQKKDCFCIYPPYAKQDGWYHVEVEYIKGVERPKISINGEEVFDLPKGYAGVLMIEQMFDVLHDEIQERPFYYTVDYDDTYGFIRYFYVNREEMLVDEEYSYEIKDFQVL